MKKKSKHSRIDPDFDCWLKETARTRYKKDLDLEQSSTREMTRILMTSPSFSKIDSELKTLPNRKKLK